MSKIKNIHFNRKAIMIKEFKDSAILLSFSNVVSIPPIEIGTIDKINRTFSFYPMNETRRVKTHRIYFRNYLHDKGYFEKELTYKIYSIDAWNSPEGWNWNNWRAICDIPRDCVFWTNRKLLAWFRENSLLTKLSIGLTAIEEHESAIDIINRKTCEPLYSISLINN